METSDQPSGGVAGGGVGAGGGDPHDADAGEAVQARLPLDLDAPIPFELTARARRVVAPASLPALELVVDPAPTLAPGEGGVAPEDPDPADTRPARARALRRAGLSLEGIATELRVEPDRVATWIGEVGPVRTARRRLRAVDGGRVATEPTLQHAAEDERARQRFDAARSGAVDEAIEQLDGSSDFAQGLGLVVGAARLSPHALLLEVDDHRLAAAMLAWVRRHLEPDERRIRVALRVAPQVAGDRGRHLWATSLGLPVGRVTVTRWRDAPDAEAMTAGIRIAEPELSGRLAGWRDAMTATLVGPAGG